jgi:YesN/AraC family two-component response regulator
MDTTTTNTTISFEASFMGRKIEVVVVDDEASITDLLESYIHFLSKNAKVHTFNDSVLAKNYIKENNVDVLITDYNMPIVNGLELMEQTSPETTRVMISGYVSEIAEEKLQELQAVFFEKPVPMKKLGQIIAEREATNAK